MEELEQLKVDFVCVCVHSVAVELVCYSRYAGDPTVGMTVEVGTLIFLKMTYGICGWGSIFMFVIPPWLFLWVRSPAIRWGHSVVCRRVDEFGSFQLKTAVIPKFRQRESGRGKSMCIILVLLSDQGWRFEEGRPRHLPLVPELIECLRECGSIWVPEECHLPFGTCLFGAC